MLLYSFGKTPEGKRRKREMGLGSVDRVPLAKARASAQEAVRLLAQGIDPLAHRQAQEAAERPIPTFAAFVAEYIQTHKAKFRNAKHIAQWEMTLGDTYCKPIHSMPINAVDTAAVLKVLQPIWAKVPETASRIRGRLENVLDAAKARGFYQGDNPARWRGHLKAILPARQRLTRGHHAALHYDALPAFMAKLRANGSLAAKALELTILTASRSGEALNAQWSEFDLDKATWVIPAARMKAGHEHRIPLPPRAVLLLKSLPRMKGNPHVFPGNKRGKPLSGMAMTMLLRRMDCGQITVHGFRSAFRDWASEQTSFPHETCEHALAHRISDKAQAAYRRGDQFEKRRALMAAWAAYCDAPSTGNVAPLKAK